MVSPSIYFAKHLNSGPLSCLQGKVLHKTYTWWWHG